jgi:pimeloyl-ACP methyl ester carboxylesterase
MSEAVRPFVVDIAESELEDLRARIAATRWPEAETVDDWSQGVPLAYTRELAEYWANSYDWRRWESRMNGLGQFMTAIDGLDIHFLHIRSPHDNARPMIISHGWPGSVVEFHKIIEPLTNPTAHGGSAEDAFHLVLPSLPGYGFSGKPAAPGTGVETIGRLWGKLMARLGYDRYVAQGGDWGSLITQSMAQTETAHCDAVHVNMPICPPDEAGLENMTERELSALAGMDHYNKLDSGYSKIQSTRPQTIGYGLADSPVGQMTWIIDKFWSWMDCGEGTDKHPENVLTKDELLDNVMMYWLSNSAASSARLYWESFNTPNLDPIAMPIGASIFPREIFRTSRRWAEKRFSNIIYWNELDRGGHFAAMEQPAVFVDELRKCFRNFDRGS